MSRLSDAVNQFVRDTNGMSPAEVRGVLGTGAPAPLSAGLEPYLDWPVEFPDGVVCRLDVCRSGHCDATGSTIITDGEVIMTIRDLLAHLAGHGGTSVG